MKVGRRGRRGWYVTVPWNISMRLTPFTEYLTYFAGKTVEMVRAPDSYVYPAPANIMEIFLIGPFE
jgi:hypothetical protein